MKKIISKSIITLSLLFTIVTSQLCLPVFGQQIPGDSEAGRSSLYPMPTNAAVGSTSERQAAWDNLSEAQKDASLAQLKDIMDTAKKQQAKQDRQPKSTTLSFADSMGSRSSKEASARISDTTTINFATEAERSTFTKCCRPSQDADGDGLTETFENSLADGFTPYYYISAGENSGTGFATFNNSTPQTVNQVFGSVPPISYFRVTPLGFYNIGGVQHGYIQIDYLTLWNRDDGLGIGNTCINLTAGLGLSLEELTSHSLDNERAAILVAAPVTTANTYNTNSSAYYAYQFFTGAHEDTFFDKSLSFSTNQPISYGLHIELRIARSKHGTYPFNPNNLPLFPDYVIFSTYSTIALLYYYDEIPWYTYLALLYAADSVFYACVVERFQSQGGTYAGTRINVGELNRPINGSNFILDTQLTQKLQKYF